MRLGLQKNKITLIASILLSLLIFLLPQETYASTSKILQTIGVMLYAMANTLGGFVLYIGGLALDISLWYLVIQMGKFFADGSSFAGAVQLGWMLIRDVINMTFIFGLIYIGIKTILDSESSGTRRQLGYLIGAALLINFSLFFTQLIVDMTNLMATQIYTQIATVGKNVQQNQYLPDEAISKAFLQASGVASLVSTEGVTRNTSPEPSKQIQGGNLIVYALMLFVFYVLAGVSFLMGTIMIITRFVALVLFMIFSPIMFVGWILPQLQSYSARWWDMFWRYGFFAPAYLFLLYISLQLLQGLSQSPAGLGSASKMKQTAAVIGQPKTTEWPEIVIGFLIMIALLIASLKIGEKMGITGSKMAMGGFKKFGFGAGALLGAAGGAATFGLAGWAGRSTFGALGNRLADSDRVKNWTTSTSRVKRTLGRSFKSGAEGVASASFDARNTALGKAAGLSGKKGGYSKDFKDKVAREKKYAESIKPSEKDLFERGGMGDIHKADEGFSASKASLLHTMYTSPDAAKRAEAKAELEKETRWHEALLATNKGTEYKKMKASMKQLQTQEMLKTIENYKTAFNKKALAEVAKEIGKDATKGDVEKLFEDLKKDLPKKDSD